MFALMEIVWTIRPILIGLNPTSWTVALGAVEKDGDTLGEPDGRAEVDGEPDGMSERDGCADGDKVAANLVGAFETTDGAFETDGIVDTLGESEGKSVGPAMYFTMVRIKIGPVVPQIAAISTVSSIPSKLLKRK
jgi:hypothetical protein